jgi:hypothetical protein
MKKWTALLLLAACILYGFAPAAVCGGEPYPAVKDTEQSNTVEPFRRGGYRSPRMGYKPGAGNPARTTPTQPGNAARNPAGAAPAPRTGFGGWFGGFFGGLAFGSLLGALFNPFYGFWMGYPFMSLISFVLWVALIYFVIRLFRRRRKEY